MATQLKVSDHEDPTTRGEGTKTAALGEDQVETERNGSEAHTQKRKTASKENKHLHTQNHKKGDCNWADYKHEAEQNLSEEVFFGDDDEDRGNSNLFNITEGTNQLCFGDPKCPPTRVPKFGKVIKDHLSVKVGKEDKRVRALTLDAIGLLTHNIMAKLAENKELIPEIVLAASKLAIKSWTMWIQDFAKGVSQ